MFKNLTTVACPKCGYLVVVCEYHCNCITGRCKKCETNFTYDNDCVNKEKEMKSYYNETKKYLLSLDTLEQMFCKEEGVLAKFTDTNKLSIEEWLQEKLK